MTLELEYCKFNSDFFSYFLHPISRMRVYNLRKYNTFDENIICYKSDEQLRKGIEVIYKRQFLNLNVISRQFNKTKVYIKLYRINELSTLRNVLEYIDNASLDIKVMNLISKYPPESNTLFICSHSEEDLILFNLQFNEFLIDFNSIVNLKFRAI